MSKLKIPPPPLTLAGYLLLVVAAGWLIIQLRWPAELMTVFMIPIFVAVVAYPVRVYLLMIAMLATETLYVDKYVGSDWAANVRMVSMLTATTLLMCEVVYRTIRGRRQAEAALRESEERYRNIFYGVPDAILVESLSGEILNVNARACEMYGYRRDELLAKNGADLVPADRSVLTAADLGRQGFLERPLETANIRANGETFPVEVSAHLETLGGETVMLVVVRDITERKQAEAALRESEERYALAVRGANDGLWDWNLRTDAVYYSPRWKEMLGYREHEVGDSPDEWFGRVRPDDLPRLRSAIALHLRGQAPHLENEQRMRHKDGDYRWMLVRCMAVWDTNGQAYRMAGSLSDITARKVAEERLAHDALHDALTGLPNRVLFMDRLGHALDQARRHPGRLSAVLFVDLDDFKVVNDSLGHMVGDQLLVATAKKLQACLRPTDTVARLGGDEFAILLDTLDDGDDAGRVADRIQERLMTVTTLSGYEKSTTASMGIALLTPDYERAEDVLRDADTAMYRAKALGKAGHQLFHVGMHARPVALLYLEAELRRAIERDELCVYYQPVVAIADGEIKGVEALVRWQRPQRGMADPSEFIPAAEETGLIVPIGKRVLQMACAQAMAWRTAGHPRLWVAVKLSARQFQDRSLLPTIRNVLDDTGLPPYALRLEIAESTAMKDPDPSVRTLNGLSAMGVQISIGEIGTGDSSLGYLKRFPLRCLKIDRSFIQDVAPDDGSQAIIAAMVATAHRLNLAVVAEGVETEAQLAFLRSQQADEAQGSLFSPPLPADMLTNRLAQGRSGLPPVA